MAPELLAAFALRHIYVFPIVAAASWVLYQRLASPLSRIPGPFWASVTRLWMVKHSWDGDMNRVMVKLHRKHGGLVRTGPNEVSVAGLDAVKKIYGAGSKFRKSDWYSVWQGHRKFDLFPERNAAVHSAQRRLVSRAYSMASLKDLEQYVDQSVEVFLHRMDEREGQNVDMGLWVQLFAFDIIGEITFSRRFGFMDTGEDDGSIAAIERALGSAAWIGQVPWLYWVHDFFTPAIGNHLAIAARHGSLRTFAMREVHARKDRGSDRRDILGKLFAAQHDSSGKLGDNDVISMATTNIFAGSDTTAISTRAIIYYLLKNPQRLQKFQREIDERRKDGRLSDPVKLAEAEDFPYLQAVMYEALRLHPAVGMSLPRVVPAGGCEIDGLFMPAGTVVGVNPWVVARNPAVYGDDFEAFRPERWLEDGDSGDMHRFFFAFGAGARMCIGRNISWMEMSKLIPTLFMHYNLQLADPGAVWTEKCWWFVIQKNLNVVLRRRELST